MGFGKCTYQKKITKPPALLSGLLTGFIVLLVTAQGLQAQQYLFKYISVRDGLPSDYVTAMHFDKSGAMWIGTDKGLCYFAGTTLQTLTIDDGLPSNLIYALVSVNDSVVLAGTSRGGAALIKRTDTGWKPDSLLLKGSNIYKIFKDNTGCIWLWVSANGESGYRLLRTPDIQRQPLQLVATMPVFNLADVDANGTVYGNDPPLVQWHYPYNSLPRTSFLKAKSIYDTAYVFAAGNRWIFLRGDSGMIMQGTYRYNFLLKKGKDYEYGSVLRMLQAGNRVLVYKTGMHNFFLTPTGQKEYLLPDPQPRVPAFFFSAATDAFGQLYLSHFGSGIQLWKQPYARVFDVPEKIFRLRITPQGVYGTSNTGVYFVPRAQHEAIKLQIPADKLPSFVFTDENGQPSFVENYGLYSPGMQKLTTLPRSFTDPSDALVKNGYTYLTSYSFGINRIYKGKPDTTWGHKLGLQSSTLERLKPGREKIYATTLSKGFYAIDIKKAAYQLFDRSRGLLSNSVYDVLEEGDTLWVATLGGITRLQGGRAASWSTAEGFRGKRALLVFRDRQQRLFVVSESYLHLFQGDKLFALRSFPLNTTTGNYISQAAFDTVLNQLWLVSANGFLRVFPDAIVPDTSRFATPKPWVSADGKLLQPQNESYSIDAMVQQLSIGLGRAPVSPYTMPEANYMLQGYHPDWQPLPIDFNITVPKLPAGSYRLMIKAIGPDLGEFPPATLATFKVKPPFWQQAWFLTAMGLALALLGYIAARRYTQLRYSRQLAEIKARQAIEMERWRISRELHDNVGSMLTLMVNRLHDDPINSPEQQEKLAAIAKTTLAQLRDAIWTLDGKELLLEQWTQRATHYLNQIELPNLSVGAFFSWPPEVRLSPLRALNAFRILQEACTNALKHAQPTTLKVSGGLSGSTLVLKIEDNGKGMEPDNLVKGYGLVNMEKRANEMQGTITWQQGQHGGTTVVLQWPGELANP